MIFVWSGKGGLVPLFNLGALVAYAASLVLFDAKHLTGTTDVLARVASAVLFGGVAVVLIYRVARSAASSKPRVLRHRETGERIVRKKTAGSFFGVPTRYWVAISAVLWTMVAVVGVMGGQLR